jgi:hypothetical protein
LRNPSIEGTDILAQQIDLDRGAGFIVAPLKSQEHPIRLTAPGYLPSIEVRDYVRTTYYPQLSLLSNTPLNANHDFETGIEEYTVINGEHATYSGDAHTGRGGIRLFPNGSLSFEVPLAETLHNPTLSLFHSYAPLNNFDITISNALTTTTVHLENLSPEYRPYFYNKWFDLTPWQGLTTTVTIQNNGPHPVNFDNVAVSEWTTPNVERVTPSYLPVPYQTTHITITGENLIPPLTATVNGASVTPTLVDARTVEIPIPAALPLGRVPIELRNRDGIPIAISVYVGNAAYIPIGQK